MIKTIYCPSVDHIDEAEKLSEAYKLPILIGDNAQTVELEFNRDLVSVISIPERNVFTLSSKRIRKNLIQIFELNNEFIDLKNNNIELLVQTSDKELWLEPNLLHQHHVKYSHRNTDIGEYKVKLFVNKELFIEETYEVFDEC